MADKFTRGDLESALSQLKLLKFFPADGAAHGAVLALLARICPHRQALEWLVDELVNHIGEWPGPAEVRGLLCTRYTAADGIDQWCTLPGYRAEDAYERHLAEHEQRKAQEKIGGYIGEEADMLRKLIKSKAWPES